MDIAVILISLGMQHTALKSFRNLVEQVSYISARRDAVSSLRTTMLKLNAHGNDYGRLWAILCWLPFLKALMIDHVSRTLAYFQLKYPNARRVLITHSYGTYASSEALLKYWDLIVHDVVHVAGVVSTRFAWNGLINHKAVSNVFNFVSTKDLVPWVANSSGWGSPAAKVLERLPKARSETSSATPAGTS